MSKYLLFIAFLLTQQNLFSQPSIIWQKCFGGPQVENANDIRLTSDKGYIFTGNTFSNGGDVTGYHGGTLDDIWVVKVDSGNNIEWQKCLGGTAGETSFRVFPTADGGYAVAGYTASIDSEITNQHGGFDEWVIKLDSVGNLQWEKTFGGTTDDKAYNLYPTASGGYLLVGTTLSNDGDVSGNHGNYDARAVALDSGGNLLWQHCYGGSGDDAFIDMAFDGMGNYYFTGYTNSNDSDVSGNHGDYDLWMVKTDTAGNLLYQKCLGGTGEDRGIAITRLATGNLIVCGLTKSANNGNVSGNHGGSDGWTIELTDSFQLSWQHCTGGIGDENFAGVVSQNGMLILCGSATSNDGDCNGLNHGANDVLVVELDSAGNSVWTKCIGGTSDDVGWGMDMNPAGDIYVCGTAYSNDNDVSGNQGVGDAWIVKLVSTSEIREQIVPSEINIYPNPSTGLFRLNLNDFITGTVEIFDALGNLVYKSSVSKLEDEINLGSIPNGVYLVRINSRERSRMGKITIVK